MKLIFYLIVTIDGEDMRIIRRGTHSSIDSGIKESIKRFCKFYDLPLSSVKCYRYETL